VEQYRQNLARTCAVLCGMESHGGIDSAQQDIPNFQRISLSREGSNFIFHRQVQRNGRCWGGGLAKRGINFWTMNPANRRTTRGRLLSSSRILSSSLSFSLSLSLLVSPKLARKRRHVLDGDKRHGETARIRRGRRNDAYETRRLVYVFKLSQRNAERGRRFIPPPCSDEKREARIFPFYLQLLPRRFVGRDFPP